MARSYIAGPREMSISFLLDEKPTVVLISSVGERSGRDDRQVRRYKQGSARCRYRTMSPQKGFNGATVPKAGELSGGNVPTIPIPPKISGLNSKTITDRVTEALLTARSKAEGRVYELERTEENKLNQISRGEIIWALESILTEHPTAFVIMRAGHTKRTAAKPASLLRVSEERV